MSAQVAADLRAAAELLRRDGWCQHMPHRGQQVCAVAAIDSVTDFGSRGSAAINFAAKRVGGSLSGFNDAPGRTADEVIAALEAAADAAERAA